LQEGEPREVLSRLLAVRSPVYAEADVIVDSGEQTPDQVADAVIAAVKSFLARDPAQAGNEKPRAATGRAMGQD
jgi:hypothetical protein